MKGQWNSRIGIIGAIEERGRTPYSTGNQDESGRQGGASQQSGRTKKGSGEATKQKTRRNSRRMLGKKRPHSHRSEEKGGDGDPDHTNATIVQPIHPNHQKCCQEDDRRLGVKCEEKVLKGEK